MDTGKEYIDMCRRAEEMQTDWGYSIRWHNGDFVYCPLNEKTVVLYSNEHHGLPPAKYLYPNSIWLPRQDQLQDIYAGYIGADGYCALIDFREWHFVILELDNLGSDKRIYDTPEQLRLAFVMEKVYKAKFRKVKNGYK